MTKTEKEPVAGLAALPGFPLVLVTVKQNILTAAAFSFFSFQPTPAVMVGIRPATYTFELLQHAKDFGINIPTPDQLDIVRWVGSVSGREEEKFNREELTPMEGAVIESVLIQECPVNLECKLVHQVQYTGSHHWFIGNIVAVHVDEEYQRDDAIMYWFGEYRRVGEIFYKGR
ncbi:MAG: flavin reductase family protein [Promethearchaeota archaeon]